MGDKFGSDFAKWLELAQKGDFSALARLLTACERNVSHVIDQSEIMNDAGKKALRIGITGPPGAGKSTLTGQLITAARKAGKKIGVIAVDPSSPFTHGAILADRIRYQEHSLDPQVFIRSLGTRGSLGGLSASAYLMARLFDLCGFDIVIIETVGVGQTELEIVNVADRVAVVLVPESGDAIQAMKAGLLEIADYFVINKSDRPGADALANDLQTSMELVGEKVEIMHTVATEGTGVQELSEVLFQPLTDGEKKARNAPARLHSEAKSLLRNQLEAQLDRRVQQIQTVADLPRVYRDETSKS